MATSGSYTYSINQGQLLAAAFSVMGVFDDDSPAPPSAIATASMALNLMIKQWMTKNYNLWCVTDVSFPVVAGQVQYPLGPGTPSYSTFRPLRIPLAQIQYDNTAPYPLQVPLIELSRQEYNGLGQKTAPGIPNSYYYDPQTGQGILSLYLTPSTTPNTIILTCQRPIQDMINSTDDFDFPIEWLNPLKFGLAAELVFDFDVPVDKADRITAKATKYLDDMCNWDQEDASTFFTADMRR